MITKFKLFISFIILGSFIVLSSCSLDIEDSREYIIGEGPLVTQVIEADTFDTFFHLAYGNVNITTGDSLEVFVRAQQNLLDKMQFIFEDDAFAWGFDSQVHIESADTILLTIRMPNAIKGVQVGGTGIINMRGNKQENLFLESAGFNEFNCYGLEVDYCEVNIPGNARCYVRVNEEISGAITGVGYVYYRGNPEINVAFSGQGDIIDDN